MCGFDPRHGNNNFPKLFIMNAQLTQKVLGINVPNLRSRELNLVPVKLNDRQAEILKNFPDHVNTKLISSVNAYQVTYRHQPTGNIKVVWSGISMASYIKESDFNKLFN